MEGSAQALIGRTIAGKFLVESFLGGGAMGAVYRARQLALDKDVAIKVLHGEHAGDPTYAARFQREAKAASKLDHPNSMRVIDFGQEPDGLLYIAMELLEGCDLFRLLQREWPLPPARIADLLSQALAALAVAHEMGIVHRDLKPENIMILSGLDDEGRPHETVKVCDFGIAKFTESREGRGTDGQKLTTQGIVVGTPEYMSPEQGKGEALDPRSDLYAVGVILYQMLTGRVPFEAESALGVVLRHVTEEPAPPRRVCPQADEQLEAICLKAMQKRREERYQSAREMRADLRAAMGAPATGRTPGPPAAGAGAGALVPAPTARVELGASAASSSATPSKLTPAGTVALGGEDARPRGGGAAWAWAALLVLAVGVGVWVARTRQASVPPPALAATPLPTAAPLTTLLPLPPAPSASDVPPLQPRQLGEPHPAARPEPRASSAPPAPSSPPAAPAQTFDPMRARVEWVLADAGGGATVAAAQRALSNRARRWTACYRRHLERRGERIEGQGTMRLSTDAFGDVSAARISGFDAMPAVEQCIAAATRGVHVDGVDAPGAWAEAHLVFLAP